MRSEDFNIQKVIDTLQGTCMTLQDGITTHYPDMDEMDMITEDHDALNNELFLCQECEWWYEISEETDSEQYAGTCENCHPDDEEDY